MRMGVLSSGIRCPVFDLGVRCFRACPDGNTFVKNHPKNNEPTVSIEPLARKIPTKCALGDCQGLPPGINAVQRLPQQARGILGGIERAIRSLGMTLDLLLELLLPHT